MLPIIQDIVDAPAGKTHLFFLGQAGFILKSKQGYTIGVDLYLSDCVARYDGFKRLMPFTIQPADIALDYLVATHAHYDHFDPDSIPELISNGKTRLFASTGCETEVQKLSLHNEKISYVTEGDSVDLGDIHLEFVFCDHGSSAPDAFGMVITIDGIMVYIAGDTCLRLDKIEEIKRGRAFDVTIAPINGAFGNLNELEAVALCKAVTPKLFIPCHYWCFAEQLGNPLTFTNEVCAQLPEQAYQLMRIGEGIVL